MIKKPAGIYTIYKTSTGQPLRKRSGKPSVSINLKDGESIYDGDLPANQYLPGGVPTDLPVRPSDSHQMNWSSAVWELDTEKVLADLADYRWRKETSGYTWNDWPVHSDDRAQFKAMAEVQRINAGKRNDGDYWKFADGQFRSLTNAELQAMYQAGEDHVAKCFTCEAACQVRIANGEYDIETIWAEEWANLTGV